MAPPRQRYAGRKRTRTVIGIALPLDLLHEILLRLPADATCRFRSVCKSWHALLSCQSFISAHAARQGPLLLAAAPYVSKPRTSHVDLMDLSGNIVRRTRTPDGMAIADIITSGSLACLVGADNTACVLNPAIGSVTELPEQLSERNKQWGKNFHVFAYTFGRAASTGEYKVLRLLNVWLQQRWQHLVEVLTIDPRDAGSARWRGKESPPFKVAGNSMHCNGIACIGSVMYFMAARMSNIDDGNDHVVPGSIALFNLETEEWMPILHGPLKNIYQGNQDDPLPSLCLSLTELEGFLVMVYSERSQPSSIDLWFLTDAKEETWVKKHNIQVELFHQRREFYTNPLFVLHGRKIVLSVRPKGVLLMYDLQDDSCRDFDFTNYAEYGLFKGCLLRCGHVHNDE